MHSRLREIYRNFIPDTAQVTKGEMLRSAAAVFAAILFISFISSLFIEGRGHVMLVASMGASSILLFAVPHSPLSQPWPVIGGNFIPAFVAISCYKLVPDVLLAISLSVSLSLLIMLYLRCLHPPGGAVALVPILGDQTVHDLGYAFLMQPMGLNLVLLLVLAYLINNLLPGRRYPARVMPVKTDIHHHGDPSALERIGIRPDDLHAALQQMNTILDVSEEDLNTVYKMAGMQAYRRKMGEISCADIMSRKVVSVEYGTELEEAWALLRYHKIKALPVVDPAQRVIGIITLVDFLKRADLKTYEGFEDKLIKFIRRTAGMNSEKPEVVGQIMASPVYMAKETMHIVQLVPLLSERGLHHIPVINEERRLVGMVTQSDLIAALYAGVVGNQ